MKAVIEQVQSVNIWGVKDEEEDVRDGLSKRSSLQAP
jgi:hypothetical protein